METLLEGALKVYEKTGALGLALFAVAVLVMLLLRYYARTIARQASEVDASHTAVRAIEEKMRKQLEELLEECKRECEEKEMQLIAKEETITRMDNKIRQLERKETELALEVAGLRNRIRILEGARQ